LSSILSSRYSLVWRTIGRRPSRQDVSHPPTWAGVTTGSCSAGTNACRVNCAVSPRGPRLCRPSKRRQELPPNPPVQRAVLRPVAEGGTFRGVEKHDGASGACGGPPRLSAGAVRRRHEVSVRQAALELAERAAAAGQHGRIIPPTDLAALAQVLPTVLPPWFCDLFTSVPLSGLELGWQEQPGGGGIAWLQWSDARNIRSESLECYPGRAILHRGYVNVASCSHGSGDSYFISLAEGEDPSLYRVYHDVSDQPDRILAEGLERVAPSLSAFFRTAHLAGEGVD
jgi:hypothetical protein